MSTHELDAWHMARALELAARGEGFVEPNPMVGCVIAAGRRSSAKVGISGSAGRMRRSRRSRWPGERPAARRCTSRWNRAAIRARRRPARRPCWPPASAAWSSPQADPFPAGGRRRHRPAEAGRASTWTSACCEAEGAAVERAVSEAARHGPPVGDRQVGDDARRQDGHSQRRQPLDLRRGVAAARASTARPRRCDRGRPRHGGARTIRCSPPDRLGRASPRGSCWTAARRSLRQASS